LRTEADRSSPPPAYHGEAPDGGTGEGAGGGGGAWGLTAEGQAAGGLPELRRALDLAAAGDWRDAAASLTGGPPRVPGLPRFPVLEAAVFLLAGRRSEAISGLVQAWRGDPHDPGLAHLLLLACYHTLQEPGSREGAAPEAPDGTAGGEPVPLVEHAVASWVALLHQDPFWSGWLEGRLRCYGEDHPATAAPALRRELVAAISARIERLVAERDGTGLLAALYARELAAATALARVGGLADPQRQGGPLVGGPLMIRQLGCQHAFGAFVAALATARREALDGASGSPGPPPGGAVTPAGRVPEEVDRLRRGFSRLGLAEALLDLDRPDEAWTALAQLACPECRGSGLADPLTQPAGAAGLGAVCRETCPRFDDENPGYAGWPEKGRRLALDAQELAVRVQVALGRAALTVPESGPAAAVAHFREACRLAAAVAKLAAAESAIVEAVLGRVKALTGKAGAGAAIALLEAALAVGEETGAQPAPAPGATAGQPAPRQELVGRLAELLAQRGLAAAGERRWEAAAQDLRRAVAWNPHAAGAVLGLAQALGGWARQLRRTAPARAIELACDAVRQLQASLPHLGGRHELADSLEAARQVARGLVLERAAELGAARGFEQALQVLEQGLAVLPGDAALAGSRRELAVRYARHLQQTGQPARALEVLQRAAGERPAKERGGPW
jgi:cellulose synthase operon protein C